MKLGDWNAEELFDVMKKLVLWHITHYVKKRGDSLIEHNIIHLRPTTRGSYDIGKIAIQGGVVTAESACGLYAMNCMLNEKEAKKAEENEMEEKVTEQKESEKNGGESNRGKRIGEETEGE